MDDLLIVAAGMGTRLRAKGDLKPLVELEGIPLIEHAIRTAMTAGLTRTTVVTGYHAEVLEEFLANLKTQYGWDIQTVHNPDFMYPNGLSVLKAAPVLEGDFVLAMCDHYTVPALYQRLLAEYRLSDHVALAVDTRLDNPYVDIDDVTKVSLAGRSIRAIGKEVSLYNAYDTGVFAAGPALFDAIEESGRTNNDYSISGGMMVLAQDKRAIGVDIGDAFWIDVDSPAMHELAVGWLAEQKQSDFALSR